MNETTCAMTSDPYDRPGAGSLLRRPAGVRSRFVLVLPRVPGYPGLPGRTITRTMVSTGGSFDDPGVSCER